MTDVLKQDFGGDVYQFSDEGWFNATIAAKKYGKQPNEWLRLPETDKYIQALTRRYGNIPYVKTSKARADNGGGTWLHPRLAVHFARWLDEDFAIWCDEQIDSIIRGDNVDMKWLKSRAYAASSYRVLGEVIKASKEEEGKTVKQHHFMNEAKLINGVLTGEYKGRDRETLTPEELERIASIEDLNTVLIARGYDYSDRKQRLKEVAVARMEVKDEA